MADQQLLESLGRQAALAIRNSQLSTELSARLTELDASRSRLVHAEEAGRAAWNAISTTVCSKSWSPYWRGWGWPGTSFGATTAWRS